MHTTYVETMKKLRKFSRCTKRLRHRCAALQHPLDLITTDWCTSQTEDSGPAEDYEKSEMLMYKNMVIQESGDMSKALAHLDEIAPNVVDGLALRQTRGELYPTHTVFFADLASDCALFT